MDCFQAQDILFQADSLQAESLDAGAIAHVAQCPACQELLTALRRIEQTAATLPPIEGSPGAKAAFLSRLQVTPQSPVGARKPPRAIKWIRPAIALAPRIAMAASVLIVAALSYWLFKPATSPEQTAVTSDGIVDQLVALDVRLAAAESLEERHQIFSVPAGSLKAAIDRGNIPQNDRELAQRLFETGTSLSRNADPLDGAQQFVEVADVLLNRMHDASAAGDLRSLRALSQNYALVSSDGLSEELARAGESGASDAATQGSNLRLQEMLSRDAALRQRLQRLLDNSPEVSRKEIVRALKAGRKARRHRRHAAGFAR